MEMWNVEYAFTQFRKTHIKVARVSEISYIAKLA